MENIKNKVNVVSVNITGGIIIAICVLILSYTHTTALFERANYKGIFAHIGVIGFELMFILGTVTVIWSKWMGEKVGKSTNFVFGLGVVINLYSNITSGFAQNGKPIVYYIFPNGWELNEAVLIGAFIPLMIVASEMVVKDAMIKHRNQNQLETTVTNQATTTVEAKSTTQPTDQVNQPPTKKVKKSIKPEQVKSEPQPVQPTVNIDPIKPTLVTDKPTIKQQPTEKDVLEQHIQTVALQMYQESGKKPSKRKLAEQAGTTDHQAYKFLTEHSKLFTA